MPITKEQLLNKTPGAVLHNQLDAPKYQQKSPSNIQIVNQTEQSLAMLGINNVQRPWSANARLVHRAHVHRRNYKETKTPGIGNKTSQANYFATHNDHSNKTAAVESIHGGLDSTMMRGRGYQGYHASGMKDKGSYKGPTTKLIDHSSNDGEKGPAIDSAEEEEHDQSNFGEQPISKDVSSQQIQRNHCKMNRNIITNTAWT